MKRWKRRGGDRERRRVGKERKETCKKQEL